MTDDELRLGLEACALERGAFGHAEHVRVCFLYLRDDGLLGTLERYPAALLAQATHHGVPHIYHETVTWGMIFMIHERMARRPELTEWPAFAEANLDLMEWPESPLFALYPRDILRSEFARTTFVLPGTVLDDVRKEGSDAHGHGHHSRTHHANSRGAT